MNLQPLYDLKERLEHAAIAGTGLIQEDFRLHRAVEGMAPLAGVNPVFGKITAAARALLTAPAVERSVRLLDVLSLVDAVAYTQGVSNAPGDLVPMTPGAGRYVAVSYGWLQPLLGALSGSGSGRTALVQQYWEEQPELFGDFRVLPHVVKALGDSYSEMAEMICAIVMQQGPGIIPMLKAGFDPAGKTEMVRRVRLIAGLSRNGENEWLTGILPDAKKDVREAVIQSLGLCQENSGLLLDLCQSERGKMKEAALRSFAMMEDARCVEFLQKEFRKKPGHIFLLKGVDSECAADLTAEAARKMLEDILAEKKPYDQTGLDNFLKLTNAMLGKYSPAMANLWRWIAGRMDQFDGIAPEKNVRNCDFTLAEHLQKTFLQTILGNSRPEMIDLARSLAEENRAWFLCGGFLADMAVMSSGEVYEKYAPLFIRNGLLKRETEAEGSDRVQIMRGLAAVRWSSKLHRFYVTFGRFDAMTGNAVSSVRLMDGMDPGWMRLLTDPKISTDGAVYNFARSDYYRKVDPAIDWLIAWLIDGDDPEVCALAGDWLYQWTWTTCQYQMHFNDLITCGWKDWKGLLVHCVLRQKEVSYYNIMELIQRMPVSNAEKAEELRRIDLMVQRREVSVRYFQWPHELIAGQIAQLEADHEMKT